MNKKQPIISIFNKWIRLSAFIAFALIALSCQPLADEVAPATIDQELSKAHEPEAFMTFTGESIVDVYGIKGKKVIMDPAIVKLLATASLRTLLVNQGFTTCWRLWPTAI